MTSSELMEFKETAKNTFRNSATLIKNFDIYIVPRAYNIFGKYEQRKYLFRLSDLLIGYPGRDMKAKLSFVKDRAVWKIYDMLSDQLIRQESYYKLKGEDEKKISAIVLNLNLEFVSGAQNKLFIIDARIGIENYQS